MIAAAGLTSALADFVWLEAAKDSTLIESPTGNFANGSGPAIFAGRIGSSVDPRRRALIAFDVAGRIPAGSVVTRVTLTLSLSATSAGPVAVKLHRVLADWGEGPATSSGGGGAPSAYGDSTWLHRFYDHEYWGAPGGDFEPVEMASVNVDQVGFYTWGSTLEMIADVQAWVDGTHGNYGWILVGDESRSTTVRQFDSREADHEFSRPHLYVEFSAPCRQLAQRKLAVPVLNVCGGHLQTKSGPLRPRVGDFHHPEADRHSAQAACSPARDRTNPAP